MSEIGHSTLLKFFVDTSKMSEQSGKTVSTITSKVPGEQTLRGDYIHELQNEKENNVAIENYSHSPVIKVTKEESTFTKGDLKVEKVIVTQDISDETANTNRKLTVTELTRPAEVQTEVHSEMSSVTINTEGDTQTSTAGDHKVVYKVTKIPKLKFKHVVEKIKKEEMIKDWKDEARIGVNVAEAVPNMKDEKNLLQDFSRSDSIQQDSPKADDEFDRIYDEIFENGPPSGNFPSPGKIEDPDKLETKFEEIIHAYHEQKSQTTNAEKVKSKIPLLKRKSEHDIFAARQTISKNSLKKRNSVDDTKCKLPVPLTKEKQIVELELSLNQKLVSAKNVTVSETGNTNISRSITTISHQKSEKNITQETEFKSISEVSKSKIPTHLKNILADEKASDIQTSEISSQLSVEKKVEYIFVNTGNINETQEHKTVVTEDDVKTLNVKVNISNIKTESPIITDKIEKVLNIKDNNNISNIKTESPIITDKIEKVLNIKDNNNISNIKTESPIITDKIEKVLNIKDNNNISNIKTESPIITGKIEKVPINKDNNNITNIKTESPIITDKIEKVPNIKDNNNISNIKTESPIITDKIEKVLNIKDNNNISNIKTESPIITDKIEKVPITKDNNNISNVKTESQIIAEKIEKVPITKDNNNISNVKTESQIIAEKIEKVPITKDNNNMSNIKTESPIITDKIEKIPITKDNNNISNIKTESPIITDKIEKVPITKDNNNISNIKNESPIITDKIEKVPNIKDNNNISNIKTESPIIAEKIEKVPITKDNNNISNIKTESPIIAEKIEKVPITKDNNNISNIKTESPIIAEKIEKVPITKDNNNISNIKTESPIITDKIEKVPITKDNNNISNVKTESPIITDKIEKVPITKDNNNISNVKTESQIIAEKTGKIEKVPITKDNNNNSNIKTEASIIADKIEKVPNVKDNNKKEFTLNIIHKKHTVNVNQETETKTKTHIVSKVDVNLKPIYNSTQNEKPLDPQNSNNDVHETNEPFENNFSKTVVQKTHVDETNGIVSVKQEVRETVRIVSPQFLNSERNNIKHDQQDKISIDVTKNIPKDILHIPGTDVYLETNSLANNSIQEIKHDNKNKLTDENTKRCDEINIDSKSATNIREEVSLKIQDNVSQDLWRSNNEINSYNHSQEYTINKLVSESTQKSLDSSLKTSREASTENNKEIINSTEQDKSIIITNQQSKAKVQPQELIKEAAKNLNLQEHPRKSENISKIITTEVNINEIKTEVIAINNEVNSSENNGKKDNELEEDIIILKGKVHRIVSRLDSKEFKVNKSEIEDLPLEESVVSKIALFEQSKPMNTTQKSIINKNKLQNEINLDKPIIVDEVLKIENGSMSSDSKFSYDTFLNYKKTIKNNINVNENKVQTISKAKSLTKFDKIYNTNINLNKFNKANENKVGSSEDDVFIKNEKANRNIINEYKINKEIDLDMRRAKSLAELNYDGVQGRVRQMVVRMNSIDKIALERREQNEVRRKPRHGSVSERIALFEQDANEQTVHLMKKVTPIRMESVSTTSSSSKPEEVTPAVTEEELTKRITELAQARVTYGHYDNMTYVELSDGGRLPSLAVGTALLDSRLIKPIIKAAIDLGYRAIDTAYIYGNEQAVGEAIREKIQDGTVKREELFVLSKLWSTNHRYDLVLRACRQSLDIMGLDYFDLYLIHNPMSFKEGPNPVPKIANVLQYSEHDYLDAWYGIESLIKQGLVKRGGVSNFNSLQVEKVLDKGKIKPVVNQVECHPYLSQARLQDYISSRGMAMSCFGSLGSSGTPRALRSSLPPVINDPLVRTMAAGLGVTPAQLLISYQVSLDRSVVVKASSAAHLWDNLRALSLRLEPAHAAGLAALNRNKRTFTFEGMGDTHKNYPFKIPF